MAHQLRGYFLQQWRSSQDCNNLRLLRRHLRFRGGPLDHVVGNRAAEFLEPPELHLAVCSDAELEIQRNASFMCGSNRSVEVTIRQEARVIACDFAWEAFALSWEDANRPGRYHIVEVIEGGCREQIMDVIEPIAAFSHDGMLFAVVAVVSREVRIVIYYVGGGLQLRHEVAIPKGLSWCLVVESLAMNFSPSMRTLAVSCGNKIFFVDVDEGVIGGLTRGYDGYDMRRLAYSENGAFLVVGGFRLNDSFDGFLFVFNASDYADPQIRIETEEEGKLVCMGEVVFSTACAEAASFENGGDQVLLLDLCTQAYSILSFDVGIDALLFTASSDEMILAQANGVLPVSDISGTAMFKVQAVRIRAHVCATS